MADDKPLPPLPSTHRLNPSADRASFEDMIISFHALESRTPSKASSNRSRSHTRYSKISQSLSKDGDDLSVRSGLRRSRSIDVPTPTSGSVAATDGTKSASDYFNGITDGVNGRESTPAVYQGIDSTILGANESARTLAEVLPASGAFPTGALHVINCIGPKDDGPNLSAYAHKVYDPSAPNSSAAVESHVAKTLSPIEEVSEGTASDTERLKEHGSYSSLGPVSTTQSEPHLASNNPYNQHGPAQHFRLWQSAIDIETRKMPQGSIAPSTSQVLLKPPSPIPEEGSDALPSSSCIPPESQAESSIDADICDAVRPRFATDPDNPQAASYSNPEEVPEPLCLSPQPSMRIFKRQRGSEKSLQLRPRPEDDEPGFPDIEVDEEVGASSVNPTPRSKYIDDDGPPVPKIPPEHLPRCHSEVSLDLIPSPLRLMPKARVHDMQPDPLVKPHEVITQEIIDFLNNGNTHTVALGPTDEEADEGALPQRSPSHDDRAQQGRRSRSASRVNRFQRRVSYQLSKVQPTATDLIRPINTDDPTSAARNIGQIKAPPRRPSMEYDVHTKIESLNPNRPPDGGKAAWCIAFCGMLGVFCTWGLVWSYGIFAAYYQAILMPDESLSKLAWIGSVQLALMFTLGQPVGVAIDRGYFRVFTISGTVLLVSGIFATSFCTQWWQFFLAQGLVTGTGMGFIFSAGTLSLFDWFDANAGKALALAASGSSLGAIVYILMFIKLTLSIGFPWTMRAIGFVTLGLMTPVAATLRMHRPRGRSARTNPTVITPPSPIDDAMKIDNVSKSYDVSDTSDSTTTLTPSTPEEKRVQRRQLRASLLEPAFLLMTLGLFFAFWGLYFAITCFPMHAISLHLSGPAAANLLIALSAANLLGRLVPGVISDACTGPINLLIPSCLLSAAFTIVWVFAKTEGSLYVVAVLYGYASGGVSALFSPMIQGFCWEDIGNRGKKTGVAFMVIGLACLTGNPIAGALVKPENGDQAYLGAQLFAGVSMLVAAIFLLLARRVKVGGWGVGRA